MHSQFAEVVETGQIGVSLGVIGDFRRVETVESVLTVVGYMVQVGVMAENQEIDCDALISATALGIALSA